MTETTLIVADDHPLVRTALREALRRGAPDIGIVECATLDQVLAAIAERGEQVDLVLLDLSMPGSQGFIGLFVLLAHHPTVPVAIISASEDSATVRRAISYGAAGFIPKSAAMEEIAAAIETILGGEVYIPADAADAPSQADDSELARRLASLSPQQMRVLSMVAEGKLNKQICYEMGVAEQTIKSHVSQILKKLGVGSRTQAVILLNRLGVERLEPLG
ncbi:MAG TPA: response regulator transcription factor [Alphaproteobacteria bacterium]|nr:response regulator transcription factor [Alphaproteobacteria bacterium]